MSEDAPPLTHEYVADKRYPTRVAAVLAGETLRTPWPWIGVATAGLAAVLVLAGAPEFLWIVAGISLLAGVLFPILTYVLIRQIGERQFPPGTVLRIGFGDEFVSSQSPIESSVTAYAAFSGAKRRGDFVLLRLRASKAWAVLPGELFSDEDLARFPKS